MLEVLQKLIEIPFWSKLADTHGFVAMVSLILFGATMVLMFYLSKDVKVLYLFKKVLLLLFLCVMLLEVIGLLVYIPYRTEGGPRTLLKSSEETAWLHETIFEHKEFLAFAPLILLFSANFIVYQLGQTFTDSANLWLQRAVKVSVILSLVFVLIVAAEAVLVTKTAPI